MDGERTAATDVVQLERDRVCMRLSWSVCVLHLGGRGHGATVACALRCSELLMLPDASAASARRIERLGRKTMEDIMRKHHGLCVEHPVRQKNSSPLAPQTPRRAGRGVWCGA